jgi:hypothetical protein
MDTIPCDFGILARPETYWAAVKPTPVRTSKKLDRVHRERQKIGVRENLDFFLASMVRSAP